MSQQCIDRHAEEFVLVPLTQGQFAKVNPWRIDEVARYKWYAKWSKDTCSFYAYRKGYPGGGKVIMVAMHRSLLGLTHGDQRQGDHRNCDTLDNRDDNLRVASQVQNSGNQRLRKSNTSGYKGVSWDGRCRKWVAMTRFEGKKVNLGRFSNPEDAHHAYCSAIRANLGEFARAS